MYDYEGDDGTACAVSFYMRLDGTEWNEELEELPPRYEEYKAALANKYRTDLSGQTGAGSARP